MTSRKNRTSLNETHTDQTRERILQSAMQLVAANPNVPEITARAVAKEAGMSERTIFRYFATRNDLLDALAGTAIEELQTPPAPTTLDELLELPARLFEGFERNINLSKATLHTELYPRIKAVSSTPRFDAIKKIVAAELKKATPKERLYLAAHLRFLLSGTAWHYYRFDFGFTAQQTVDAVRSAISRSFAL